jgi:predicted glycoside hydrolase/deacetylase ChbG (UPF0249 family)
MHRPPKPSTINTLSSNSKLFPTQVFNSFSSYPDAFVGLALMGNNMTLERLQEALLGAFSSLEDQGAMGVHTVELMCHPGYPCTDPTAGCGFGADEFSMSEERRHEMKILSSKEMKDFYHHCDICLVDGIK